MRFLPYKPVPLTEASRPRQTGQRVASLGRTVGQRGSGQRSASDNSEPRAAREQPERYDLRTTSGEGNGGAAGRQADEATSSVPNEMLGGSRRAA